MTTATDLLGTQLLAHLDETFEHAHGRCLDRRTSLLDTLMNHRARASTRRAR